MTDLVLAITHHLLVFTLVAILAAELALYRAGMRGEALHRLSRLDAAYGLSALLVISVGIARVMLGIKGPRYYLPNPWFWGKMAAIVLIALLSIGPTISLQRWRRAVRADPAFVPPPDAVARSRRFLHAEAALLVIVLVSAAAMARRGTF